MKAFVFGLGVVISFIGLMTIFGYAFKCANLYRWSEESSGMAINTAIGFVIAGLAICILSSRSHPQLCKPRR
jgi:hypothetical protein